MWAPEFQLNSRLNPGRPGDSSSSGGGGSGSGSGGGSDSDGEQSSSLRELVGANERLPEDRRVRKRLGLRLA